MIISNNLYDQADHVAWNIMLHIMDRPECKNIPPIMMADALLEKICWIERYVFDQTDDEVLAKCRNCLK
jgi:hypothetical protein